MRGKWSSLSIAFVAIFCIWNSFSECRWVDTAVMGWDAACYYAYLTKMINHKPDIETQDEKFILGLNPINKYVTAPNGNKVLKTTMGMAVLYSPVYSVAYAWHYLKYGNAGTGIEMKYRMVMQFYGTIVLLLGLLLLRRLLKKYFSDVVIAVALLVLVFGTNLIYYTTYEGLMPHVTDMFLFLVFIYATEKWYSAPGIFPGIFIGLLAGLMTLVRPTNALIGIVFILYNVSSYQQLKRRLLLLWSKTPLFFIMIFCAFLVWVPQMAYWYKRTGHFYFYSYVNEHFYFLRPMIFQGLLGGRKGWLIYTPVGFLILAGFVVLPRYVKGLFWPIIIFFPVFTYVIFCWWCWWYGGSFSCRAIIDAYPLLAFPLAALLQYIFIDTKRASFKIVFGVLLVLLVANNLFRTYQYKKGIMHYQDMTYAAYENIFFSTSPPPDSLLREPNWDLAGCGAYGGR